MGCSERYLRLCGDELSQETKGYSHVVVWSEANLPHWATPSLSSNLIAYRDEFFMRLKYYSLAFDNNN